VTTTIEPKACLSLYAKIENGAATGVPIIVVPGGPGMSHTYLTVLAPLIPNSPIIFYDPRGTGRSFLEEESTDWSLKSLVDEISQVREFFGFEHYVLLSHSAGTIQAMGHCLDFPKGLLGAIFISPIFSVDSYCRGIRRLIDQMNLEHQGVYNQLCLGSGSHKDLNIQEALAVFAENHLCRLPVWPDILFDASCEMNTKMRDYLWGKHDFHVTGQWRSINFLSDLPQLSLPILLIRGEHDYIDAISLREYKKRLPNAQIIELSKASHSPYYEVPGALSAVISAYLQDLGVAK